MAFGDSGSWEGTTRTPSVSGTLTAIVGAAGTDVIPLGSGTSPGSGGNFTLSVSGDGSSVTFANWSGRVTDGILVDAVDQTGVERLVFSIFHQLRWISF